MANDNINWRHLAPFLSKFKAALKAILIVCVLDIFVSILFSQFTSDSILLSRYLNDDYDEVIERFMSGNTALIPDEAAGWINAPNYSKGNWTTDSLGSWVTSSSVETSAENIRLMLLGSSAINGGIGVGADEIISAYLQQSGFETLNFGTMLYSIDQSLFNYTNRLSRLNSDVIIVGVHHEPTTISNLFVPFRSASEFFMPFLKPGYLNVDGELTPIRYPIFSQGSHELRKSMLKYLHKHDHFYYKFETYKYFGHMPIANYIRSIYLRIRHHFIEGERSYKEAVELQKMIMDRFVKSAEAHGSKVIFLEFSGKGRRRSLLKRLLLPDYDLIHEEMLQSTGHSVVLVANVLLSDGGSDKDYYRDAVHFTAKGNKLIADALATKIRAIADCGSKCRSAGLGAFTSTE